VGLTKTTGFFGTCQPCCLNPAIKIGRPAAY